MDVGDFPTLYIDKGIYLFRQRKRWFEYGFGLRCLQSLTARSSFTACLVRQLYYHCSGQVVPLVLNSTTLPTHISAGKFQPISRRSK